MREVLAPLYRLRRLGGRERVGNGAAIDAAAPHRDVRAPYSEVALWIRFQQVPHAHAARVLHQLGPQVGGGRVGGKRLSRRAGRDPPSVTGPAPPVDRETLGRCGARRTRPPWRQTCDFVPSICTFAFLHGCCVGWPPIPEQSRSGRLPPASGSTRPRFVAPWTSTTSFRCDGLGAPLRPRAASLTVHRPRTARR